MLIALYILRRYNISDMDQLLYKAVNISNRKQENKNLWQLYEYHSYVNHSWNACAQLISEARVSSVWSETSSVAVYEDAQSYSSGPSLIA